MSLIAVFNSSLISRLISDFLCDSSFDKLLRYANKKHDLLALEIFDPNEVKLPNVGILPVKDIESGATNWINTSSRTVRSQYEQRAVERKLLLHEMFKKSGVDFVEIATNDDYVKKLMKMFSKRMSR